MSEPLVVLHDVRKSYGRARVLTIEHLVLQPGRSVLIHGANGSGKSTLLRVLAGISQPDAGRVERAPAIAQGRLGFLPQSGGLYGELSVRANLRLRRRIFGLPDVPLRDAWYLDALDLGPSLDKKVAQLSGGFQRLAAIAATLHIEPDWLLLDEPFNGVDHPRRQVLRERLGEIMGRVALFVVAAPTVEDMLELGATIRVSKGRLA